MKIADRKEMGTKTVPELKDNLRQVEEQFKKAAVEIAVKKPKDVHALRLLRRDIARLHTIIRAKEIMEEVKGNANEK